MTCPLAVFSSTSGAPSETFIQRHISLLLEGRTAVVVENDQPPGPKAWSVNGPFLALNRLTPSLPARVRRALCGRVGLAQRDFREAIVRRFVEEQGVQVALMEYLDTCLPWLPTVHEMGVRVVVHGHGYDISAQRLQDPEWKNRYRPLRDVAALVVPHGRGRELLIEAGFATEKVHVVPYGVSVPQEPVLRPRAREDDTVHCLAVGRMVSKKAPILLMEAFRQAFLACPSLRLLYIGEGPLFQAAVQFVRAFGLEKAVTLAGVRSNDFVQQALRETDIFLQHSWTDPETGDEEGLPVAILEAMAAGLPVASTRHAGIPDAVTNEETGLLVEPGDVGAHTQAILRLAGDPDLRVTLGRQAWVRAKEHFSWERERSALLKLLELNA